MRLPDQKARIAADSGPASESPEMLERLIRAAEQDTRRLPAARREDRCRERAR